MVMSTPSEPPPDTVVPEKPVSRRQRKRAAALALDERELALAERKLAHERDRADFDAEMAARQPIAEPQPSKEPSNTLRAVPWTWWRILALTLLTPGTLVFGAFMALVVIGLQVGFWQGFLPLELHHINLKLLGDLSLDLPQFIPVAVEGGAWIFTALAVVMVLFGRDPRRYTQYMWLLSGFAAVINAVHNSALGQLAGQHDWFTGLFTGMLSVLGPFIVHSLVVAMTEIVKGTTIGRALLAGVIGTASPLQLVLDAVATVLLLVFDLLVHPIISVRAIGVWRGVRHFSYRQAWDYVAKPYYAKLHITYRDRVHKQYSAGGGTPYTGNVPGVPRHVPAEPFDIGLASANETKNGGVLTAQNDDRDDQRSAENGRDDEARRDIEMDLDALARLTEAELAAVFGTPSVTVANGEDSTDRDGQSRVGHPDPAADRNSDRAEEDAPLAAAGRGAGAKQRVARYWWQLKNAGADPGTLNKADVARKLGVSRPTVSKVFKACANGQYPNPASERSGTDRDTKPGTDEAAP
jgi:hypothetical protein